MAYSAALRRYEEQYDALKAELQTLGFVGQGGVHTRRITCGRATCRCHDDPDARHSPYHYTSVPQSQAQASASCGRARSGGEWVVKRSSRGRRSKTLS